MRCSCPYCGQTLLVNLPAMAQPATPPVVHPVSGQKDSEGGSPGLKILLTVLIVLVVGGLGAFGFILWQDRQEAAQQEIRVQRKAHADSLMQVRARQEAQSSSQTIRIRPTMPVTSRLTVAR